MTGDAPAAGRHRGDRHDSRGQGWWWALTQAPRRRLLDPSSNPRTGLLVMAAMVFLFGEGFTEVFGQVAWYIRLRGSAMVLAGFVILGLLVAYLGRPATIPPEPALWRVARDGIRGRRRRPQAEPNASEVEQRSGKSDE